MTSSEFSVRRLPQPSGGGARGGQLAPPPCFFSELCLQAAAVEKAGRSVCNRCASRLRGREYPLRNPSPEPLYFTGRAAAEALDMLDD